MYLHGKTYCRHEHTIERIKDEEGFVDRGSGKIRSGHVEN